MCDSVTKQMVQKAVTNFISKGFMFTAFDITKLLRATGQKIQHGDVQEAVKEMFRDNEMGQYVRDTKDVGAPVAPFVYYHPYSDLANYDTSWLDNNPSQDGMRNDTSTDGSQSADPVSQPTSQTVAQPQTVSTPKPTLPRGQVMPNVEGRLNISPMLTKQIGLSPKQTVWVDIDGKTLKIRSKSYGTNSWPITVNDDGRIRVCRTLLSKIAIPVMVPYKIGMVYSLTNSGGEILVEKA